MQNQCFLLKSACYTFTKFKQPQKILCVFVSSKLRFFQASENLISLSHQAICLKNIFNL